MSDPFEPRFGWPVTEWFRWFAWHPVETTDRGWRWLVPVYRRRIEKHAYLPGGAERWFQHVTRPTTETPERNTAE